jgi:dihydrodipicolinate synthase/N-acetylneuraminate lyase
MNCKLEGILSANVTPFKDNCKLDEPGLRRLIRGTQRVGVRNVLGEIVSSKFAR